MARPDETLVRLGKATAIIVTGLRKAGKPHAEIRRDVEAAFREALTGVSPWVTPVEFPGRGHPEKALSIAGVYRLILEIEDVDRADQVLQETLTGVVRMALDRELEWWGKGGWG